MSYELKYINVKNKDPQAHSSVFQWIAIIKPLDLMEDILL